MTINNKEFVEELKVEWNKLWRERVDDKVRAEGVAIEDYSALFVDKGTIIHATRDFKALNFKDILETYKVPNPERYIPVDPKVGGWNKFIKTNLQTQKGNACTANFFEQKKVKPQQAKKNGRGWLHA
jgi:hypothetical protein